MINGFGLNTNLFETNILNLTVVVGIVVTVVGDAIRVLLDQRRNIVLLILQEVDKKAREAQQRLEEARKAVETARLRAQEIRIRAIQASDQEKLTAKKQLERDLQRLQEIREKTLQLEYQRTVQIITKEVTSLALDTAEDTLRVAFSSQGQNCSKHKKLNDTKLERLIKDVRNSYDPNIFRIL
jgi:F-type H+-transporting ATPase subunit b